MASATRPCRTVHTPLNKPLCLAAYTTVIVQMRDLIPLGPGKYYGYLPFLRDGLQRRGVDVVITTVGFSEDAATQGVPPPLNGTFCLANHLTVIV